jgi:hypothetical protein
MASLPQENPVYEKVKLKAITLLYPVNQPCCSIIYLLNDDVTFSIHMGILPFEVYNFHNL